MAVTAFLTHNNIPVRSCSLKFAYIARKGIRLQKSDSFWNKLHQFLAGVYPYFAMNRLLSGTMSSTRFRSDGNTNATPLRREYRSSRNRAADTFCSRSRYEEAITRHSPWMSLVPPNTTERSILQNP